MDESVAVHGGILLFFATCKVVQVKASPTLIDTCVNKRRNRVTEDGIPLHLKYLPPDGVLERKSGTVESFSDDPTS